MNLTQSISSLSGIGEKRRALYARLGIESIGDLLRHFPRAYQNRSLIRPLDQLKDEEICAVLVTVATDPRSATLKNRLEILKFRVFDATGSATVTFFGMPHLKKVIRVGMELRLFGKCKVRFGDIEFVSPQLEPCLPGKPLPDYVPIYPLTQGLSQKMIAAAVSQALSRIASEFRPATPDSPLLPDPIPPSIRKSRSLPDLFTALRLIHQPSGEEDIRIARNRFVYESLYLFALGISGMKEERKHARPPVLAPASLDPFLSALPFELTPDQKSCLRDIASDLSPSAQKPMARLISGDVGSGKTLVAAGAIYLCCKGGCQSMLMAPTEILATQHFTELSPLFTTLGIKCALLTGSTKAAEKRRIKEAFSSGALDLLIGTHALITDDVMAQNLGLVITDEQHRFGVGQRAKLAGDRSAKEEAPICSLTPTCDPHVLVMSATPIPRTLALILYGDLDVSTIQTLPPGRQIVDTYVVGESYRARLFAFIRKQIEAGGQVYVVCPAIEPPAADEDESLAQGRFLDLFSLSEESAEEQPPMHYAIPHAQFLQESLPDLRVGCLHGRMKGAEKEAVMQAFVSGQIQVLVSTTVIEVGVNVPRASLMLIENAERFGLSQLHQLRGRVGRGKLKSYCVLISDAKGETAKKRLAVLRQMASGFDIAKEDLKLRGPGDFFPSSDGSARQSGQFSIGFASASLCTDMDQLKEAALDAQSTLRADPHLQSPENRLASELLSTMFYRGRHGQS